MTTTPDTPTAERVTLHDDYYPYTYPVPSTYAHDLMADEATRWAVLADIGIARPADDTVTPLAAWRDAVADASGVDRAALDPSRGGVLDLGFSPAYVRTFVLYLA
jgi:hypothetical protein